MTGDNTQPWAVHLFRLEVPAGKRSFTVAEALEAIAHALHPELKDSEQTFIESVFKVERHPVFGDFTGRRGELANADWQVLRVIWAGLDEPKFPMSLEQWQPYAYAFNSSPHKPKDWALSPLQRQPDSQSRMKRVITEQEHRDRLKRVVESGAVSLLNPMTRIQSECDWPGNADDWLLSRADMKAYCDPLGIELVDMPHFITSAHPVEIPPELLALAPDARITYAHNIGRQHGNGATTAGQYLEMLRATIARQAEGYFTLNEAAQVLADSRPGMDPVDTVVWFLEAPRHELPIHRHDAGRRPKRPGETIRDFLDLLEVSELDAWLRKSAGYGFPPAAGASELPGDAPTPATAAEPAPAAGVASEGSAGKSVIDTVTAPALTLTTPQLAAAFDGACGKSMLQWRDILADNRNHAWVLPALAIRATAPKPSTWYPLKFAELLAGRGESFDDLSRRFVNDATLKPWLPAWQEAKRERNAFGQ